MLSKKTADARLNREHRCSCLPQGFRTIYFDVHNASRTSRWPSRFGRLCFVLGPYTTTIHVHQTAVDVGTRDDKDILQWLRENAVEDDFVALKFDVDNDFSLGPTMEWGFLADLLRRPEALALVDELFVELHFFAPSLRWVHLTHSMKQAFDVLRELRACGLPVHAWP